MLIQYKTFEDVLWSYDREFCSWMGERNCLYCEKGNKDWVCDFHSTSGYAYKINLKIGRKTANGKAKAGKIKQKRKNNLKNQRSPLKLLTAKPK